MEWNRSRTIALAAACCTTCQGIGLVSRARRDDAPCKCVFRTIFRICYEQFRLCAERQGRCTTVALEQCGRSSERRVFWAMNNEDYMADFLLVSRRVLRPDDYRLFRYHYLLGVGWNLYCRRFGMDRGIFFHTVYRIQHILGRTFAELQPYPLFPLREYFNGETGGPRKPPARALTLDGAGHSILRPPVRNIA